MADPNSARDDDARLIAYLDDVLPQEERAALTARIASDPVLQARLGALDPGRVDYREAYDLLLDAAPNERLQAILDNATGASASRLPRRGIAAIVAAAAVVLFAGGVGLGVAVDTWMRPPLAQVAEAQPPSWRQVVAEYLVLTTADTLAAMPDNPSIGNDLAVIGDRLDLMLTTDLLALPHVYLKDARLYDFRGQPLAQISYLAGDDGAVAFCIISNGQPDAGFAFEQREGSNIVFWTKDGRGYMLAGKAPRERLQVLATDLAADVS